jgi:hypothetical protein
VFSIVYFPVPKNRYTHIANTTDTVDSPWPLPVAFVLFPQLPILKVYIPSLLFEKDKIASPTHPYLPTDVKKV